MVFFRSPQAAAESPRPDPGPPVTGAVIPLDQRTPRAAMRARAAEFGVDSEVGVLRRVIVHRPGPELLRLTPENKDEFLFDDVVWAEGAEKEHDALSEILRTRGVEVMYLGDLLSQTLEVPEARGQLLEATLRELRLGPTLGAAVASWLATLPAIDLARRLIGGVTYSELPFSSQALPAQLNASDGFVIPPLPNQMFTRDSSTWLTGGAAVHRMASWTRSREALHLEAIYRWHPAFAGAERVWSDSGSESALPLEGGDILVLGPRTLAVGTGERTDPVAVEVCALRLFEANAVDRVIAVVLPRRRSSIHLDTVMTMVDRDTFMVYAPILDALEIYVLSPSRTGVRADRVQDLSSSLSAVLGTSVRLIHGAVDHGIAQREQWDEGANLLALAPGVVVAYERNTHANARLREEGIEVLTVPAAELARGRGGPRCLTCPVAREPI